MTEGWLEGGLGTVRAVKGRRCVDVYRLHGLPGPILLVKGLRGLSQLLMGSVVSD